MGKRGPAPRSKDGVPTKLFAIRLTTAERKVYEAAANAAELSLSEWIRAACDEKLKRAKR